MSTADLNGQLAALASRIKSDLPGADTDLTVFPSGGAMLDLRRNGRLFVLSYSPSRGFGVDEVRDGEGFQLGYRFAFDALEPAAEKLAELAAGTASAPQNQEATAS